MQSIYVHSSITAMPISPGNIEAFSLIVQPVGWGISLLPKKIGAFDHHEFSPYSIMTSLLEIT